ncbi:MAG TPA: TylF/MycF/NovP-related O-methyltransferase [Acidobacteriaceae bacterium]|nr:TylF/MycF/NovP-related O-methyltransferase [Acidobacteriaceae bacterium]
MSALRRKLRVARKLPAQALTGLFSRAAFYLQGQMDIHPASRWYNEPFVRRFGGFSPKSDTSQRAVMNLQPWDCVRRDMLVLLLRGVEERQVSGDFAELGVYRGSTARLIHRYAPARILHLFDTFTGFDRADVALERAAESPRGTPAYFSNTSLAKVVDVVGEPRHTVLTHPGRFPDSIPPELSSRSFAFVHLDADLYAPIRSGLEFFYPRLSRGGVLVIHDYNAWEGARQAVDEFFADKPELPVPMPDKSGSAVILRMAR